MAASNILIVNGVDLSPYLVSSYKVGQPMLVSDKSGRNAQGDNFIYLLKRKAKIYTTLYAKTTEELKTIYEALWPFIVSVTFLDPKTNTTRTITANTGDLESDYKCISDMDISVEPMDINFIEL